MDTHVALPQGRLQHWPWSIRVGLTLVLVMAAGAISALAFPPHEWWWIAWVSLIPFCWALRRVTHPASAGALGFLFGAVFLNCALPWLSSMFSERMLVWYLLAGTLPFALFAVAEHVTRRKLSPTVHYLLVPVLWVAADFFRCEGWHYQFSWGQLGQTQVAWQGGLALYPLIGVYGVSFLLVATNAALVALLLARDKAGRRGPLITLACIALLVGCAFPLQRLVTRQGRQKSVHALLVQAEDGGPQRLFDLTLAARGTPVDLVVWHESAVGDVLSSPKQLAQLRGLARILQCTLVVGCAEKGKGSRHYNAALILSPAGEIIGTYRKRHPVQTMEAGIVPGDHSPSFATPVGRLGIAICYDFDYAACTWQAVHNGAELLAVPTYDAAGWSDLQHTQHARIAQTRAAEAGRWVLRATSSGVSQVITSRGEIAALLPNHVSGTVRAQVYPLTQRTLYIRLCYLLPYACVALSCLVLLLLLVNGIRKPRVGVD